VRHKYIYYIDWTGTTLIIFGKKFDWFCNVIFCFDVLECIDSCSNTNIVDTPIGKVGMKRSLASIDSTAVCVTEAREAFLILPNQWNVRVKIESDDWEWGLMGDIK